MIKKLSLCLLAFSASFTATCGNAFFGNSKSRAENWQPRIDLPSSVVVCRQKQCAPAKLSMSREYIYNSLLHLLDNNSQNKALVCRADPSSHICVENYITVPITVGVTPANMYIDDVKITDVSASVANKSLDLILHYNISYNGQIPVCKPAKTLIYVKNAQNIVMEDSGYSCKMTTIGNTTVKTLFAIDYVDLDYGYIGGYYSIGLSGPAFGGDSGYMLMRMPQDAYPLSPELILKEEVEEIKDEPKVEEVKEEPKVEEVKEEEVKEEPKIEEVKEEPKVEEVKEEQVPVIVQTVIGADGLPVQVKLDANGKPILMADSTPEPLDENGNMLPTPAIMPEVQYDINGNPFPTNEPMPYLGFDANGNPLSVPNSVVQPDVNANPVPQPFMPQPQYDINGNPMPFVSPMQFDINGNPMPAPQPYMPHVQFDINGNPLPMPQPYTSPMQFDVNGNVMPAPQPYMPQPQFNANVNPVPAPQPYMPPVQFDVNGNPMPMSQPYMPPVQFDINGNPMPMSQAYLPQVQLDANGNPLMTPAVDYDGQAVEQADEGVKAKPRKESRKKGKRKPKPRPKKSSDIETSVTTTIVPMEKRQPLPKPEPEVVEPKPVATEYEGVKIYPLPIKKKVTTDKVEVKTGSNLKDDIAQMQ